MYIGIVIGAIAGALVLAAAVLVCGTLLYRKYILYILPIKYGFSLMNTQMDDTN